MEQEFAACEECGLVYLQPAGPPDQCHGCDGETFAPIDPKDLLPRTPPQKWGRYLS